MTADTAAAPVPVIQVVHGAPSADELGVVVALLAAAGGEPAPEPERPASHWAAPAARLGSTGPTRGGWRRSGMPR